MTNKFKKLLDKLEVETEPGLTTSQLMLINHDLLPGGLLFALHWNPKLVHSRDSMKVKN